MPWTIDDLISRGDEARMTARGLRREYNRVAALAASTHAAVARRHWPHPLNGNYPTINYGLVNRIR